MEAGERRMELKKGGRGEERDCNSHRGGEKSYSDSLSPSTQTPHMPSLAINLSPHIHTSMCEHTHIHTVVGSAGKRFSRSELQRAAQRPERRRRLDTASHISN